jgi:glycosyltransferase involved in cell wall biosynthesis
LTRAIEAAVIRRSSFVISVNEYMTRRFAQRYGHEPAGKFATIQNGYDPSDFDAAGKEAPSSRFRLLYAGSLYGTRSPSNVLEGFRRFLEAVPGSRTHARFDFAGRPGPFLSELKSFSDDGVVRYLGMLPHAGALRSMASADVNVVILPKAHGGENDTTAKIYECLGSYRALLAAVPSNGAAAAVLRQFSGVWMCDPDDPDEIARAMKEMYSRWLAGTLNVVRRTKRLWPYTRERQTAELASLLDAAVDKRRNGETSKRENGETGKR